MSLKINLSVEGIATSDTDTNEIISNDEIKKISFAAGGHTNEYDFVTYVAKDKRDNRYCHIFDCGILADDVLSTIGQIFSILNDQADEDLEHDAAIITANPDAPQLDNPLYHAMADAPKKRKSSAEINTAYDAATAVCCAGLLDASTVALIGLPCRPPPISLCGPLVAL